MAGHVTLSTLKKEERTNALVQESLKCASHCLNQNNYGRAYAHLLLVIQLRPDLKHTYLKDEFVLSLKKWSEQLERLGRIEDLFKCYDQTCEIFPECDVAMNNIGAQLFRLGYVDEAAVFVRRSLKLSPSYLAAKENLENICCHLVERWHFRMLNDMARNRAFRDAIDMAIARGHQHVLDIGAGTGLLSLFATEAGASSVFACEQSKTMLAVAQEVLESNSAMFRVCLLPKHSTDLVIPQDIPTRVTLVTTETFDAGLFGEHIVSTLHHAWQHLLTTETDSGFNGMVIPRGADVYLTAIQCETIRKQNRLLYPVLMNLDLTGISILSTTCTDRKEPYTTEDLLCIQGGYQQLSEPKSVLEVNFNDPLEVDKLHSGLKLTFDLDIVHSGEIDAIAMWFDLHLDDSITITTAPDTFNCWEQAIFPVQPNHFTSKSSSDKCMYERENLAVKPGDALTVNLSLVDDCLTIMCSNIKRKHRMHASPSQVKTGISSQAESQTEQEHDIERVKIDILDSKTNTESKTPQSCISKSSEMEFEIERVVSSDSKPNSERSISSNVISSERNWQLEIKSELELDIVKIGTTSSDSKPNGEIKTLPSLASVTNDQVECERESHMELSDAVSETHQTSERTVNREKVHMLIGSEISRLNDMTFHKAFHKGLERHLHRCHNHHLSMLDLSTGLSPLGLQASLLGYSDITMVTNADHIREILLNIAEVNSIDERKLNFTTTQGVMETDAEFDVIVCDMVETSGVLRQQVLEDLALLRLTSLSSDGIILPHKLTAVGICIESEQLLKSSRVTNKATLGFNIADFMKEFQASTHLDIDLHALQYTKLSEPFQMFQLEFNENSSGQELPAFLQQEKEVEVEFIDSGQFDAVAYWFEMQVLDEIKLVTVDSSLHWKQAAKILNESKNIESGENMTLSIMLKNSYIDIKCLTKNE